MRFLNRGDCFCLATVRKPDAAARSSLTDFGKYVADCLPKYVQKAQLTSGDELEILICPEGVVPVLQFLKDHHNSQFANLVDIAGMDVPSRQYRFEVNDEILSYFKYTRFNLSGSSLANLQHPVVALQLAHPRQNLHGRTDAHRLVQQRV